MHKLNFKQLTEMFPSLSFLGDLADIKDIDLIIARSLAELESTGFTTTQSFEKIPTDTLESTKRVHPHFIDEFLMEIQPIKIQLPESPIKSQKGTQMQTQEKLTGIICLDNLSKNTFGQLVTMHGMKVLHTEPSVAVTEAERLARENPGKRFATFTIQTVSQVNPSITTQV